MNIKEVREMTCHRVTTDESEHNYYTRYGPDSWTVTMGESDEQVYDCAELEAEFQAFIARNGATNPKRGSSHAASVAAEGETP